MLRYSMWVYDPRLQCGRKTGKGEPMKCANPYCKDRADTHTWPYCWICAIFMGKRS